MRRPAASSTNNALALDKNSIELRLALAESRHPMTLLELDQALYVQRMQTYRYSYLFSYLNTWPKLFSCLDWLAETGSITRTEKDGVLFWSLR